MEDIRPSFGKLMVDIRLSVVKVKFPGLLAEWLSAEAEKWPGPH
jgi:hypothetical protein